MTNLSHITRCGLPGIEWVAFARCNGRRIVTLSSRALAHCNNQQMSEAMNADHCGWGVWTQLASVRGPQVSWRL
jgi:hypothetical protein